MKILMVTRETQADQRYGLGRSLMPLLQAFRLRGITVDYLCQADLGQRALLWQHRCLAIGSFLLGKWPVSTNLPALLQVLLERINMGRLAAKLSTTQQYTHVHCHDPFIAAGLRFFLHFYRNQPIVWGITEHGFGCYAQAIHEDGIHMSASMMRLIRRWEAHTLLAASWVIAPTRRCLNQIADDLRISPLPGDWYSIVHARPALNHYSRQEARQRLGWDNNAIYILSVGRIAPVKRFPMLIEACSKLILEKDWQLVILGEGDHHLLQQQAQHLQFTREILFAVTDDVGLYLCAADLYVSASASESFGLANLEALTAGTAAVCTAVGGVPEVVGDGALLSASDTDALAEAMQRMLNDVQLRQRISQNGRARAEAWPDIIEITDQYETIYRQAAAG